MKTSSNIGRVGKLYFAWIRNRPAALWSLYSYTPSRVLSLPISHKAPLRHDFDSQLPGIRAGSRCAAGRTFDGFPEQRAEKPFEYFSFVYNYEGMIRSYSFPPEWSLLMDNNNRNCKTIVVASISCAIIDSSQGSLARLAELPLKPINDTN